MATEAEIIASNVLASAIEYKRLYDTTKKNEYKVKEQRLRRIAENIKLIVASTSTSAVSSFNGRTGAVTLTAADVNGALGYTAGDMLKSVYDYDNDGVVDSAERTEIIVRNSTGSTLTKGTVVYLSGATGNRPNALRAQANSEATSSKTFGFVVADILNNADGYVACAGTLHDLDTSAFADGAALWLSPTVAGGWTTTVPSEPDHSVFLGYVARSHPTLGRIVILIKNGYEINELHDVVAPSPSNGDLLYYDSALGYWKNWTPTFGGASAAGANTQIQFNDAGVFGADSDFTWNKTTNVLTVGGTAAFVDVSQTASFGVGYKIGSKWVTRYNSTLNNFIFGSDGATYASVTTANNNFFAGNNAIALGLTSGFNNIAIGFDNSNNEPLRNLTSGNANIALSRGALRGVTSGFANVGIGEFAGYTISTTGDNIAIGYLALRLSVRTGAIAIGTSALENFVGNGAEDDYSIAIGYTAGRQVSNGRHVLIGYLAGRDMSAATADGVTAIGERTGYGLRTSTYDTAIGGAAMGWFNSLQTTTSNVAVGFGAMQLAPWSRYMVAIGYQAGYQNGVATASGQNDGSVYVGYQSGFSNLGNNNVFLGYLSGYLETTASNTFILANGSAVGTQILRGSFTDKWVRVQDTLRFTARTSNPSVSEAGHIYYNSTAVKHKWYDGTSTAALSPDLIKPVSIWSPTASDKITLYKTDKAITIKKLFDVVVGTGSPSVTWQIKYATTRDSATPTNLFSVARTTTSTAGASTTTFASASIPAGSYIWLELSAVSGTVDEFNISFLVTED